MTLKQSQPLNPVDDKQFFVEIRSILKSNVENMLNYISVLRENNKIQTDDLFSDLEEKSEQKLVLNPPQKLEPALELLLQEKTSLGIYVSGKPMDLFEPMLSFCRNLTHDNRIHLVLVEKLKKVFTRAGGIMLAMKLTTVEGDFEGLIFTKKALIYSPIVEEKQIFWVYAAAPRNNQKQVKKVVEAGEEEEKVYQETPRLLIEHLVPFEEGPLKLLNGVEANLSITAENILSQINWSDFKMYPERFVEAINPKSEKAQVVNKPVQLTSAPNTQNPKTTPNLEAKPKLISHTFNLAMSLGPEKLAEIGRLLKTSETDIKYKITLKVETTTGWKQSKQEFLISQETFQKINQLVGVN